MRVTVCQWDDTTDKMEPQWQALRSHLSEQRSDFCLLPEMPFCPWPAYRAEPDETVWGKAVAAHDRWIERLGELGDVLVAGSRPVGIGDQRRNEAFVWSRAEGYRAVHHKYYLPNEPGFWEANWYRRGEKSFEAASLGEASAGFLVCTELWFHQHAWQYGRQGIELLLCPRATPAGSTEKWLCGGRTAAVVSGAFCLSSNRAGAAPGELAWGACGWIIDPEEGDVVAVTSDRQPMVTATIDLARAASAKRSYPRYVQT